MELDRTIKIKQRIVDEYILDIIFLGLLSVIYTLTFLQLRSQLMTLDQVALHSEILTVSLQFMLFLVAYITRIVFCIFYLAFSTPLNFRCALLTTLMPIIWMFVPVLYLLYSYH